MKISTFSRLYELRSKGIMTRHGGRYFQNAKTIRTTIGNIKPSQNTSLHSVWEWKHLSMMNSSTKTNQKSLTGSEQILKHCLDLNQLPKKRRSTPLNIIGWYS